MKDKIMKILEWKLGELSFKLTSNYRPYGISRPSIQFIKKTFNGKKLIGAEIGVRHGYNAKNILLMLNIEKLYLVDPYIDYDEYRHDVKLIGRKDIIVSNLKEYAKKYLRDFEGKTEFVYKNSVDAVNIIPNNLDFVYIDACHTYNFVLNDMFNYYSKLKVGGILCGHDYTSEMDVPKAIDVFLKKYNNLILNFADCDYWIVKRG